MSNFTKSIVYSGVIVAAALIAVFAIYDNMSGPQNAASQIEPAAGEASAIPGTEQTTGVTPDGTEAATNPEAASDAAATAPQATTDGTVTAPADAAAAAATTPAAAGDDAAAEDVQDSTSTTTPAAAPTTPAKDAPAAQ